MNSYNDDDPENSRYTELINRLAELCGIISEYWDIFGSRNVADTESKKSALNGMGFRTGSSDEIEKEIYSLTSAAAERFMEPVYILPAESPTLCIYVQIPLPHEDQSISFDWILRSESDDNLTINRTDSSYQIEWTYEFDRIVYAKISLCLFSENEKHPAPGYYDLELSFSSDNANSALASSKIIIAPDKCYLPDSLRNQKQWGLMVNLYALRTDNNLGIGNIGQLQEIIIKSSKLGSSFVGINPLNAIPNNMPFGISPYSPVSRLYKNFIYIDLESVIDLFDLSEYQKMITSDEFSVELEKLNRSSLIDYEKSAKLKESALRMAFEHFYNKHYLQSTQRAAEFKKYITSQGTSLRQYATYMALAEHFAARNPEDRFSWSAWPEEYRDPVSRKVTNFAEHNKKAILYWKYIQWLLDSQFKSAADTAERSGMEIGIYHDLAVGSVSNGSDIWSFRDIFALSMDTGAPPDDFNPDGQNWGLPPVMPEKLRNSGYEYFIQTLRQNMKHCGAIRIDHALGMFRRYWIPKGSHARDGVYVRYPADDLFRIIALESMLNNTVVIAEDLGTIGENVWDTLQKYSALSYKLLYFQRDYPDPDFLLPEKYPEMAICSVTTHDLPTLFGFWAGKDINLRRRLGIIKDDQEMEGSFTERLRDKRLLIQKLAESGIETADIDTEITPRLCTAVYEFLSKTPCLLLALNLDDILGTMEQQNMPGTIDEHPNWRQKTEQTLKEILSDSLFKNLAERFAATGRGTHSINN
ncbi:MAG: 4-alpha-glucanotransferase [Dissulfurispiraceae bacterium]|jgi:4-alpha-glucanotransferase|nr:4-alpha-glucanotransferase [Dissulfurispiraceae bacterium]